MVNHGGTQGLSKQVSKAFRARVFHIIGKSVRISVPGCRACAWLPHGSLWASLHLQRFGKGQDMDIRSFPVWKLSMAVYVK